MTFNQLRDKIFASYEAGVISDDELVQIIEQASSYLNLKTLTNYAKTNKVKIDNQTFIIDNE